MMNWIKSFRSLSTSLEVFLLFYLALIYIFGTFLTLHRAGLIGALMVVVVLPLFLLLFSGLSFWLLFLMIEQLIKSFGGEKTSKNYYLYLIGFFISLLIFAIISLPHFITALFFWILFLITVQCFETFGGTTNSKIYRFSLALLYGLFLGVSFFKLEYSFLGISCWALFLLTKKINRIFEEKNESKFLANIRLAIFYLGFLYITYYRAWRPSLTNFIALTQGVVEYN